MLDKVNYFLKKNIFPYLIILYNIDTSDGHINKNQEENSNFYSKVKKNSLRHCNHLFTQVIYQF